MPDIIFKLSDRFSPGMFTMRSAAHAFDAELQTTQNRARDFRTRLDELTKSQSKLEVELQKSKNELRDAQKAFRETGSAADNDKLLSAQQKYNEVKNSVSGAKDAANSARSSLRDLNEEMRKMENGDTLTMSGSGNVFGSLASAGLFKQLGSAAAGLGSTVLTMGATGEESTMLNSLLSGAASGAAVGSLAGPVGTAIGGVVGAVSGTIEGATNVIQSRNEAFKTYYNDLYGKLEDAMAENLENGISIAGSRETTGLSYLTLLGGNKQLADDTLMSIKDFADRTPFMFDDLADLGKSLISYGYDAEDITGTLTSIGGAGAAVGTDSSGLQTIVDVIGRLSTGEISAMQMRRLTYLGLNPYTMMAEEYNNQNGTALGQADIKKLVSGGQITGEWAADALLDYYSAHFGASLEQFSQTYEGLSSTVQGLEQNQQNAMGEGYNTVRMEGMKEQIEWYKSAVGGEVEDAYGVIGESKAYLENYSEKLKDAAEAWVLTGQKSDLFTNPEIIEQLNEAAGQYSGAVKKYGSGTDEDKAEAGITMQSILEKADGIADAVYDGSDIIETQTEAMTDLTSALQDTAEAVRAWKPEYKLQQAQTRGLSSNENGIKWFNKWFGMDTPGFAYGLSYVPYNGFPAILHEGEEIRTAGEARRKSGGSVMIGKLADSVVIREEADIDKFAAAFAQKISMAADIG